MEVILPARAWTVQPNPTPMQKDATVEWLAQYCRTERTDTGWLSFILVKPNLPCVPS
jgi:hypothetical protein